MDIFSPHIPTWISIAFLVAIPAPIVMIAGLARKGSTAGSKANRVFIGVLAFYVAYLAYVTFACFQGWFAEVSLPPKILLFSMIPLLGFYLLVVFNLPAYKSILRNTQTADWIRLHIFRLIGSFFLVLAFCDALPWVFALIAGLGDLISALSSLFVAKAVAQNRPYAKKLALAWNTFGFLDILATSATAVILTKASIDTGAEGVETLAEFPFCFIPAFAPATIIFLHLSIYRKLLARNS